MGSLIYREGTTREIDVLCLNEDKTPFDLSQYTSQVYIAFDDNDGVYLPTTHEDSTVKFIIPAYLSVGRKMGEAEVRLFQGDEVISVTTISITIAKSRKPDIIFHGGD